MQTKAVDKGRASLIIDYTSAIHFSTVDDFAMARVSLDATQIPFDGLKRLLLRPYAAGGLKLFQIDCRFEFNIRKDKKEYIALKKVLDGNEPDQDHNTCLSDRLNNYECLVKKLMEYLIWRKKVFINPPFKKDIDTKYCSWTLDDSAPQQYPINKQWHIVGESEDYEIFQKDLSVSDFDDFKKVSAKSSPMPLYHELLDESYRLVVTEQYRGAFLTLYSALEVGTKALVGCERPETNWIKNNTQGPPLEEIYKDILNKEGRIILDETALELLKNMTGARNMIAHQGKDVEAKSFRKYRNFVRQILYKIDNQMGYSWTEKEEESSFYTDEFRDFLQIIVP